MTIDNLEIEIKSSASQASDGINKLTKSLESLKGLAPSKIGLGTLANQLNKLNTALSSMSGVSKLNVLAVTLENLSTVSKPAGFKSAITQLSKLPELANQLQQADMDKFASSLQRVADAIKPLATEMEKVSKGFSALPPRIQKLILNNEKLATSNKKTSSSFGILGTGIKSWEARLATAVLKARMVGRAIGGFIEKSNEYVENVNLFTVSLGEYAEQEKKYAELVGDKLGIDPSDWLRAQGVFNTLATGFGIANDKAVEMSRNLTQLSYDISSLYNIKVSDSMTKLQSAFSGELEPVRRLGYDISQAKLQEIATSKGIGIKVSEMNQAEKSMLRYYALMTQVTEAQGDMARTLESPANQLRIFKSQIQQTARAIGNVFIPMLNIVLPYLIAFLKIIRLIADNIASMFGFQMPEIDYSSVEKTSNSLQEATESAKKFKNATMGFDELNILGDGDTEEAMGGVRFDLDMPEYKGFLEGITESRADKIFKSMKDNLGIILATLGLILVAAVAWKLALLGATAPGVFTAFISNFVMILTILGIVASLGIMIYGIWDAWNNGLDWSNLLTVFAGILLLCGILLAKFGLIGLAIGLFIGGVALIAIGVKDIMDNGLNSQNLTAIFIGLTLIAIAFLAIGAPIGALIVLIVGIFVAIFAFMDKVQGVVHVIGAVFVNVGALLLNFMLTVKAIKDNIGIFFANLALGILSAFKAMINNLVVAFQRFVVNTKLKFLDFQDNVLTVIKTIIDKANDLLGVFGVDIDTSGIEKKLEEVKKKKEELNTELEELDYSDIGEAFKKGMETIDYKDLGETFNTFDAFEEGWAEEAWNTGEQVGASFRDGILDSLQEKFGSDATVNVETKTDNNKLGNIIGDSFKTELDTSKLGLDMSSVSETVNGDLLKNQNTQLDQLKTLDTNVVKTETDITHSISSTQSVLGSKLDAVEDACRDIRINVTKVYGGDGYASGGYPTTGEMFYARENGMPELVGRIGSRTAVANNDQITEGIATAVYNAMMSANQGGNENNFNIYLDGRQINASVEKVKKEKGTSIMTGGLIYG